MNVLDLFSGIGGFSLGLERAGMRTVAFCEIDPFCRAVLRKRWPHVRCYPDVRELTAARLGADGIPRPDLICGGFPCQDISLAGERSGLDGERSGLWREFARLIGEIRPKYAIVENTTGLLSLGMDEVLGDLAEIGYDAEWRCISAAELGFDHIRTRVWVCAYPSGVGCRRQRCSEQRSTLLETGRLVPKRDRSWPNAAHRFGATYGIPGRLDRIRALGNAVVPAIPEIIGQAIMRATRHDT
jgi:DNA (cytosine-5)-methyltransferase 1